MPGAQSALPMSHTVAHTVPTRDRARTLTAVDALLGRPYSRHTSSRARSAVSARPMWTSTVLTEIPSTAATSA